MLNSDFLSALRDSISFAVSDADAAVNSINERFDSAATLLAADFEMLASIPELGEQGACFMRLAVSIAARRISDGFKFARVHTEDEIVEYFKALFLTETSEVVYCMLFDGAGKAIACEFISEGTVTTTEILPRKMLEIAIKRHASSIIVAHNHPGGKPVASVDDIVATEKISSLFSHSGKRLLCHYVIAGAEYSKIDCPQ